VRVGLADPTDLGRAIRLDRKGGPIPFSQVRGLSNALVPATFLGGTDGPGFAGLMDRAGA
jgi:hypothetical protein